MIVILIYLFSLQFHQLLNLAKEKNLIDHEDHKDLKQTANVKLSWQEDRLKQFENEFFAGKCKGNGP